jgi:putative membrane protein
VRVIGYIVVSWLVNAVVLAIVAWIYTDIDTGTTRQLLAAAAIFGILNTFLKPLLQLLTLPLAVVTLGVAWFFVSMLMLWLTDEIVPGFTIHGFWALVWATITVAIVNFLLDCVFAYYGRGSRHQHAIAAT